MQRPRVRITSDGRLTGTQVTVDGEPLDGVRAFSIRGDVADGLGSAVVVELELEHVELDVAGELQTDA